MAPPTNKSNLQLSEKGRVLNINVGVLGHVDSGKTSLVKTLSTLLSTAALDKSSQSRQRGITLDLGFSAFFLDDVPAQIKQSPIYKSQNVDKIQVTLVDCPGHASLIRTIIGGAQIIDQMILVIDAVKGMQTQTAECLVIAEMTTRNLIIALNKIDLFPEKERASRVNQVAGRIRSALRNSRFADAPMVGISACIGGEKVAAIQKDQSLQQTSSTNIDGLLNLIKKHMTPPNRNYLENDQPFHFAIDHCFPIKGQGTVLTGTVLSGSAKANDMLQFPEIGLERKIKSMQMFRKPILQIVQGDRAGICVTNLEAKLIERGVASTPGSVSLVSDAIAVVKKVKYFPGKLISNSKFHVSVGHNTVMASAIFFGGQELAAKGISGEDSDERDSGGPSSSLGGSATSDLPRFKFDFEDDFVLQNELLETLEDEDAIDDMKMRKKNHIRKMPLNLAIIHFQTPVFCPLNSLIIGSRLDTDINASTCRLAFCGRLIKKIDPSKESENVKFYTRKEKEGVIFRLGDSYMRDEDKKVVRYEVYGTDLFGKDTNMNQFVGLKLETDSGDVGVIHSSFGTSGKFRIKFPGGTDAKEGDKLFLRYKRYLNDKAKVMHQENSLPLASSGTLLVPETKEKKPKQKKKVKSSAGCAGSVSTEGKVVSIKANNVVIVAGFFSPEINIREKIGWIVQSACGATGSIIASFGKAGKCKVSFQDGHHASEGTAVTLVPPDD